LKDLRQHSAQDRGCCTHTEGYPRFPDLRPIGTPIPVPGRIGKRGFPIPDSGRVGNRGFPSPFPGQIGNRGNGNWGFPGLCCRPRRSPNRQVLPRASAGLSHDGSARCRQPRSIPRIAPPRARAADHAECHAPRSQRPGARAARLGPCGGRRSQRPPQIEAGRNVASPPHATSTARHTGSWPRPTRTRTCRTFKLLR